MKKIEVQQTVCQRIGALLQQSLQTSTLDESNTYSEMDEVAYSSVDEGTMSSQEEFDEWLQSEYSDTEDESSEDDNGPSAYWTF